jgi:hypothetical protein
MVQCCQQCLHGTPCHNRNERISTNTFSRLIPKIFSHRDRKQLPGEQEAITGTNDTSLPSDFSASAVIPAEQEIKVAKKNRPNHFSRFSEVQFPSLTKICFKKSVSSENYVKWTEKSLELTNHLRN